MRPAFEHCILHALLTVSESNSSMSAWPDSSAPDGVCWRQSCDGTVHLLASACPHRRYILYSSEVVGSNWLGGRREEINGGREIVTQTEGAREMVGECERDSNKRWDGQVEGEKMRHTILHLIFVSVNVFAFITESWLFDLAFRKWPNSQAGFIFKPVSKLELIFNTTVRTRDYFQWCISFVIILSLLCFGFSFSFSCTFLSLFFLVLFCIICGIDCYSRVEQSKTLFSFSMSTQSFWITPQLTWKKMNGCWKCWWTSQTFYRYVLLELVQLSAAVLIC